jgi:hypothetical protein
MIRSPKIRAAFLRSRSDLRSDIVERAVVTSVTEVPLRFVTLPDAASTIHEHSDVAKYEKRHRKKRTAINYC